MLLNVKKRSKINKAGKGVSLLVNESKFKKTVKYFRAHSCLYVMMIPFLLFYILFMFKPMYGLVIAFKDYSVFKGITGSEWVGLEHFKSFVSSPYFWRTLKNTLLLNVLTLVFSLPANIIFALMINEVRSKKRKSTLQTLSYMPHFISSVIVVGIVINMLSPSYGVIPMLIEKICGVRPYLLMDPRYFRTIYIIMNIWTGVGFGSIVYLAAISGVDQQLYEAAVIDGAGKFKQIWHVTIPGIMPTIMTMLIMSIGSLLSSSVDTILLLQQPATYEVSDVIGTYVYREGLIDGNYSYATAVSIFQSGIGLMLVIVANKLSKKYAETGLW